MTSLSLSLVTGTGGVFLSYSRRSSTMYERLYSKQDRMNHESVVRTQDSVKLNDHLVLFLKHRFVSL